MTLDFLQVPYNGHGRKAFFLKFQGIVLFLHYHPDVFDTQSECMQGREWSEQNSLVLSTEVILISAVVLSKKS